MPRLRANVDVCTDCASALCEEGTGVALFQSNDFPPLRFMCAHIRRDELAAGRTLNREAR